MLDQLKKKTEDLWQQLIYAKSEAEKATLRGQYQEALKTYKTQHTLVYDHVPKPRTTPGKRRDVDQPNPFSFVDYREFLLAWLRHYKAKKGGSLEKLAEETGLSAEFIVRALRRFRKLDFESHKKILAQIALAPIEREFLDTLYQVSETESREIRQGAVMKLLTFAEFRKAHPKEYEAWHYLSHWYYVAIREMSTLPGFQANAPWIQARLSGEVAVDEIKKALDFLEQGSFFKKLADGRIESLMKPIHCAGGVYRLALGQFHREMLEKAQDAIRNSPSDQRYLQGHSMAVSRDKYEQICRILSEAAEKVEALGAGDEGEDPIYHVELALFPLSRILPKRQIAQSGK